VSATAPAQSRPTFDSKRPRIGQRIAGHPLHQRTRQTECRPPPGQAGCAETRIPFTTASSHAPSGVSSTRTTSARAMARLPIAIDSRPRPAGRRRKSDVPDGLMSIRRASIDPTWSYTRPRTPTGGPARSPIVVEEAAAAIPGFPRWLGGRPTVASAPMTALRIVAATGLRYSAMVPHRADMRAATRSLSTTTAGLLPGASLDRTDTRWRRPACGRNMSCARRGTRRPSLVRVPVGRQRRGVASSLLGLAEMLAWRPLQGQGGSRRFRRRRSPPGLGRGGRASSGSASRGF
jgi:hypothetical protein